MILSDNERIDYVNDSLSLIQKTDGLTFGTDALLLAGYINGKFKDGIELGGGSGIISMLLLTRKKVESITCIEVQQEYANLIERNTELNGLTDTLHTVCADVREYKHPSECELVFSNPPYMKSTSGAHNRRSAKTVARHEIHGDISDFLKSAARLLKFGGTFAAVYRPDRLTDIIAAMRDAAIEPKRMTFVHADVCSEPSMVLIEGRRGGKSGLTLTRPLIIYSDECHTKYGSDMDFIMENGVFPPDFKR